MGSNGKGEDYNSIGKITRNGSALSINIPKRFLKLCGWKRGDMLVLHLSGQTMQVEKISWEGLMNHLKATVTR